MTGLNWQKLQIPLASGLGQKWDPRALEAPALTICRDAEFDELGGIQTRKPFLGMSADKLGGGSISDPRRAVAFGNERLLFTKDALYSWNEQLSQWVSKGTHLAVTVEETPRFLNTADQVDADRAELDGTVVYAWTEAEETSYVAAIDKATGSVLLAPTQVFGSAFRPRLVALDTKILLFVHDGTENLLVYALDPADPGATLGGSGSLVWLAIANYGYDVVRIPGVDTAIVATRHTTTTSYAVARVTAGLAISSTTKARPCLAAIALSCSPDGTYVQIARSATNTTVVGDLLNASSLADVYTNQAIGTTSGNQAHAIAAAHSSTLAGGQYRCYVFWSSDETDGGGADWETRSNWVDTGNALGTAAAIAKRLGVRSRAFDHEGRVFVHLAFWQVSEFIGLASPTLFGAPAPQNTYFLYRDDGFLVAKVAAGRAGAGGTGHATDGARWLPSVIATGDGEYSWCALERRVIALAGGQRSYADRGPRDVVIRFDQNAARRCVRLGGTLYITGGEVLQYDGQQLTEVGFHLYPFYFAAGQGSTVDGLADGTYYYRGTLHWQNAQGENDRSTSATYGVVTVSSGPDAVDILDSAPVPVTHKTTNPPAWQWWRSLKNPANTDVLFYLVSSLDPNNATNPNRYVANDRDADELDAFSDELTDADIAGNQTEPEGLEPIAPPAATIIAASLDRLWLAGVAGEPNRVWYSKQRGDNEVASFHELLTLSVPATEGAITAIAMLGETPVVFCERAVYLLAGNGIDNNGGGLNYEPRRIPCDVGAVSAEAVAPCDKGVVFKSRKGWYLLGPGGGVDYIGAPIVDHDDEEVVAVHALDHRHQIRVLTTARALVLDTQAGQWAEWTLGGGSTLIGAVLWDGAHAILRTGNAAPLVEAEDHSSGVNYGLDIETAWIKLDGPQGRGKIRWVHALGEYRGDHKLRVRLARDYRTSYFQDKVWTPSPTVIGDPLQVRHGPSQQTMQAIKVRLTAVDTEIPEGEDEEAIIVPSTEAIKLTSLALEVGLHPGTTRHLPAAQKQ